VAVDPLPQDLKVQIGVPVSARLAEVVYRHGSKICAGRLNTSRKFSSIRKSAITKRRRLRKLLLQQGPEILPLRFPRERLWSKQVIVCRR
jgi:hypothetical protein